jgi:hypothetical protein
VKVTKELVVGRPYVVPCVPVRPGYAKSSDEFALRSQLDHPAVKRGPAAAGVHVTASLLHAMLRGAEKMTPMATSSLTAGTR